MASDLRVELIGESDDVFAFRGVAYQISPSRRKLKRLRWTMVAVERLDSIEKKIVAPKMRSKASVGT